MNQQKKKSTCDNRPGRTIQSAQDKQAKQTYASPLSAAVQWHRERGAAQPATPCLPACIYVASSCYRSQRDSLQETPFAMPGHVLAWQTMWPAVQGQSQPDSEPTTAITLLACLQASLTCASLCTYRVSENARVKVLLKCCCCLTRPHTIYNKTTMVQRPNPCS